MVHIFYPAWGRTKGVAPYGASIRMTDADTDTVARQPEEPTPQQVLDEMNPCEPYTAGELTERFDDASRWTIQRRLQTLLDEEKIQRKEHAENRVSWWQEDG